MVGFNRGQHRAVRSTRGSPRDGIAVEWVSVANKWGLPHYFSVNAASEFLNLYIILNSEVLIESEGFYHVCALNEESKLSGKGL